MATFTPVKPVPTIQPPNTGFPFVDIKSGILSIPANQHLQQIWASVNGGAVPIGCACQQNSVNVLVLTPLSAAKNSISFFDFMSVRFIAAATSTGALTATIGSMVNVPVYKSRGTAAAGSGDIVINSFYELVYASFLNANAGGVIII